LKNTARIRLNKTNQLCRPLDHVDRPTSCI